jgi:integration host factor subunit beta
LDIVTTLFDSIQNTLVSNGRVELRGFGSFFVKEYDGYVGRNPKSGEYVSVKPKKLPGFRMGKDIKKCLR